MHLKNFSQQNVQEILLASAFPYYGLGRCVVGLNIPLNAQHPSKPLALISLAKWINGCPTSL